MDYHVKRQGRRYVVVDAAGVPLTGPLSLEDAQAQRIAIAMAEHARREIDPLVLKQRSDKAAYRQAERDPWLKALKNFLPRKGEIERTTQASQEGMLKIVGACMSIASSDPAVHAELAKTSGQRRTSKATAARDRRGGSTTEQVLALAMNGAKQVDIAKKLGLSAEWVCKIIKKAKQST
jgi:hypothetical protein